VHGGFVGSTPSQRANAVEGREGSECFVCVMSSSIAVQLGHGRVCVDGRLRRGRGKGAKRRVGRSIQGIDSEELSEAISRREFGEI
jgi:hypothetical protein